MQNNKIIVGITQGDSNGIGYEVIIKVHSGNIRLVKTFRILPKDYS